jgi:hypothetical protein
MLLEEIPHQVDGPCGSPKFEFFVEDARTPEHRLQNHRQDKYAEHHQMGSSHRAVPESSFWKRPTVTVLERKYPRAVRVPTVMTLE